ncbi:MAG: deoxyribodipyrimidine photo-lyase [Coriobacteriia bacterium]|nr:deoxyribodipyrimidine photo-lyase [Coriobacteriia bacterium]
MSSPVILLFTDDLRLADNPTVAAAMASGRAIVPVFVDDPVRSARRTRGAGAMWLRRSLDALDASLQTRGSRLIRRTGAAPEVLAALAREIGADTVFRSRRRWPEHLATDSTMDAALAEAGVRVVTRDVELLHDPAEVTSAAGTPYTVFSPFARTAREHLHLGGLGGAPASIPAPESWPESHVPAPDLRPGDDDQLDAGGWEPGEAGARDRLDRFLADALADYADERDVPGRRGTSMLSPHLRHGEISAARVWTAAEEAGCAEPFLRQLLWREFAYNLLEAFPHTVERPLRDGFSTFPWSRDDEGLASWQRGETGFPMVDAGMRELAATGWMHNRSRMVTASFLVKDLLLPWQSGAAWFAQGLFDADTANNTFGWQWVAGSGADAAPYVRVFNPATQGTRFDADGSYVRRWLPELAAVPDRWIHHPWEAPADVLARAGVTIGCEYPAPIIDHAEARRRALAVFAALKRAAP